MQILPIDDLFVKPTKEAFESLFRKHYASLCRSVHRIIQDKNASEDIVQEVFATLWDRRESIEIQSSIKSYLSRASMNAALNHLKREKRWTVLDGEDESQSIAAVVDIQKEMEGSELQTLIEQAINQLPVGCRTMFMMNRYEEMSYKEIAEATQTSVKTVENQIGKALKVLRYSLRRYINTLIFIILQFF